MRSKSSFRSHYRVSIDFARELHRIIARSTVRQLILEEQRGGGEREKSWRENCERFVCRRRQGLFMRYEQSETLLTHIYTYKL